MNPAQDLPYVRLVVASAFVVLAGLSSMLLRLRLERSIVIAATRTVVQLALVGVVLQWIFDHQQAWIVMLAMLVMLAAAARAAVTRPSRSFARAGTSAFITLLLTGGITALSVTQFVVRVQPWYDAQYLLPLLGMILGNGLTGISLALDSILEAMDQRADVIEQELCLGATKWEAVRQPLSEAVRRGMIPIINAMTVVGIVSLPGMMTGQILAGANPAIAVKYQIVVMFMLLGSTSLGCTGVALWAYRAIFDDAHRLRSERIRRRAH